MSPSNDPLTNGDDSLIRGDEEAERGATAEAQKSFELALAQFRSVDGDDVRRANGKLGQADAHRRLGDLAERTRGALGEARKHYAAAVRLLAPLMPLQDGRPVSSASFECQALRSEYQALRGLLVYTLLQVARLDAMADQPGAEVFFRFALDLEEETRSVLWHYVGAYCQRRLLPIAAFLAHQQSIEELPSDDDDGMLMALHQQLVALNSLHAKGPDEILGMLGIVGLLERQGALSHGDSRVKSSAEIIAQLALAPEARVRLLQTLDRPANLVLLRDRVVTRMRSAIPDFAQRFVAGQLNLEDTRHAVLPASTPEA